MSDCFSIYLTRRVSLRKECTDYLRLKNQVGGQDLINACLREASEVISLTELLFGKEHTSSTANL